MLFNSWPFLPFAAAVLALYYVLPHRWQNRMLLAASYVFYGAWDYRFLSLILVSTLVDYLCGIKIHEAREPTKRKAYVTLSCVVNLGILGVFKYFNFFADAAGNLLAVFGLSSSLVTLNVILPVGISFYTFQSLSYTIDIYRGKLTPQRNVLDFSLYVAYFPQLVAGPIERATRLLPQLTSKRSVKADYLVQGGWLILWGYFKKLVIADNMGLVANQVFESSEPVTGFQVLLAVYAFAIQIYGDFSGYTDIARGLAKLMGIDLMENFNLPYLAKNPSEFWRRWHISLSTWLRDYLYIPLGGNRVGRWKTYRNLMVTMVLGGLWHGAAWTFVIWGLFHGVILILHRWLARELEVLRSRNVFTAGLSLAGMFHLTCLGWLLFRANSIGQVGYFLQQLVTDFSFSVTDLIDLGVPLVLFTGALWSLEAWIRNVDDPRTRPAWAWGLGAATCTLLFVGLIFFVAEGQTEFIYFQF